MMIPSFMCHFTRFYLLLSGRPVLICSKPPNRSWRLKSVDDIWRHGPFHEPPSHGAVGAGRLDVKQFDKPKWLRHEHCHSSREQGGHAWLQGWLLCLEGDFELRRSGPVAKAGPERSLAKLSYWNLWDLLYIYNGFILHSPVWPLSFDTCTLPNLFRCTAKKGSMKYRWYIIYIQRGREMASMHCFCGFPAP